LLYGDSHLDDVIRRLHPILRAKPEWQFLLAASSPDPEVPEKAQRRKFSADGKKRNLEEVDRATGHGGIGAVLRREGILDVARYVVGWMIAHRESK
jgi:hypothetical protein